MITPNSPIRGRYSDGYNKPTSNTANAQPKNENLLKLANKCCCGTQKRTGCGCGCGSGQPRYAYSTPGAGSGQSATMMMPNIVINVQSGNRRSADYTDLHSANTTYSPSEANPYLFAPTTTENNPYFTSFEQRGNTFSPGGRWPSPDLDAPQTSPDVVPIILSPKAKAQARTTFNPGPPPEYVGRRYPLEFP